PMPCTGLLRALDSLGEGGDRLIEPTHSPQGEAEVVQRHAFTMPVVGLPKDLHGGGGDGDPVVEVAAEVKEPGEAERKVGAGSRQLVAGGAGADSDQVGMFGIQ